jgi:hypothetical protein
MSKDPKRSPADGMGGAIACSMVLAFGERGSAAKIAMDGRTMAVTSNPAKQHLGFRIVIIRCLAGLQVLDDLEPSL